MSSDFSSEVSASDSPTRRRLLALGGAGGAAGLAALLSHDHAVAGHAGTNVFHLGENNTNPAGATTVLHANGADALGVEGTVSVGGALPGGPGLSVSDSNVGGKAIDAGHSGGVGVAVYGTSRDGPGGSGGHGVVGASATADGSEETGNGIGVSGTTGAGIGVLGSTSTTGIGVEARTAGSETPLDALALLVRGRSAFSTAGAAVVPAGQESVFVENAAVTGESHISVTLTSDPGNRTIRWVEQDPGSGFTVHLTSAPPPKRPETSLTYLIVEPFDEV